MQEAVFEGEWGAEGATSPKGERFGRGTARFATGDVYDGEWVRPASVEPAISCSRARTAGRSGD